MTSKWSDLIPKTDPWHTGTPEGPDDVFTADPIWGLPGTVRVAIEEQRHATARESQGGISVTDMTPAKATALRKPFPPESVGKLPKGGAMLDYVGHAAVTDRLLTVDPNWSWEPLALGPDGLPALDRSGNLWIRLTVCGVSRIGVGDGKTAKECIGDAVRNAAMRFGVALDLWAKENLVEFAQAATSAQRPAPEPTPPPTVADPTPAKPMAEKTRREMFALFGQKGIADDRQLAGINQIVGASYESRGDLTETHAREVIKALRVMPDADTPLEGGAA